MGDPNLAVEIEPDVRGYALLQEGAGWRRLERDVLQVAGPDAATFLQGQLTQDVAGLAPGTSAWSLILAPAGRVDALVRVWRLDADTFVLDTDGGWGEVVTTRLSRFRLRTKAAIERLDWSVIGVRGPDAQRLAGLAPAGSGAPDTSGSPGDSSSPQGSGGPQDSGYSGDSSSPQGSGGPRHSGDTGERRVGRLDASWPGLPGVDLIGPGAAPPDGITEVGAGAWDAARIEAGVPQMGTELTEKTIPAEAGIVDRTVSFTKGCFTGQELVARIDSRGSNVPRYLRGLRMAASLDPGTVLVSEGKDVGWVTSVAHSPVQGWVGLGYVARAVVPPATLHGAGVAVAAVMLPLVV